MCKRFNLFQLLLIDLQQPRISFFSRSLLFSFQTNKTFNVYLHVLSLLRKFCNLFHFHRIEMYKTLSFQFDFLCGTGCRSPCQLVFICSLVSPQLLQQRNKQKFPKVQNPSFLKSFRLKVTLTFQEAVFVFNYYSLWISFLFFFILFSILT